MKKNIFLLALLLMAYFHQFIQVTHCFLIPRFDSIFGMFPHFSKFRGSLQFPSFLFFFDSSALLFSWNIGGIFFI
jgi:hypothetical protein